METRNISYQVSNRLIICAPRSILKSHYFYIMQGKPKRSCKSNTHKFLVQKEMSNIKNQKEEQGNILEFDCMLFYNNDLHGRSLPMFLNSDWSEGFEILNDFIVYGIFLGLKDFLGVKGFLGFMEFMELF